MKKHIAKFLITVIAISLLTVSVYAFNTCRPGMAYVSVYGHDALAYTSEDSDCPNLRYLTAKVKGTYGYGADPYSTISFSGPIGAGYTQVSSSYTKASTHIYKQVQNQWTARCYECGANGNGVVSW